MALRLIGFSSIGSAKLNKNAKANNILRNKYWFIFILIFHWDLINKVTAIESESFSVLAIEYPPFTTEEQPEGGVLMAELAAKTSPYGLFPKPMFMPLVRVQRILQEGDWCASFAPPLNFQHYPSVATSLKRLAFHLYRVKQKSAFQWRNLTELEGREVALIRSMEGTIATQELLQSGMTPVYVNSLAQALKMLAKMRVDYALADEHSYHYYQQ